MSPATASLGVVASLADAFPFEMKVTGADQAQLQIVIPPDVAGKVPTPKPWKLE
jgi:hypothetical protein